MRLPVVACNVLASDGSQTRSLHVFCPRWGRSVDVSCCELCGHAQTVSSSVVDCIPGVPGVRMPEPSEGADAKPGQVRMPEPSEGADAEPEQRDVDSVPIGIIASREFMCARVDVPVRAVESVVPPEPWALPIVDMHGRFFGFISKTLLAASDLPPRLALAVPAMQIASGSALAVHETCSLRCAIHAMAMHGTRIIAILDASGDLRGVLTDIEALRAIANETSTFRLG